MDLKTQVKQAHWNVSKTCTSISCTNSLMKLPLLTAGVAGRRLMNRSILALSATAKRAWLHWIIDSISRQPTWMNVALGSLGSWLLATALTAIPALGAERITFFRGPFQFSLSIDALEAYAKLGKITDEFNFYAQRANPQQLAQLRDLLTRRFEVSPTLVSQFSYSPIGETVLQRLGGILQTDSRLNGFYALRSAFILAAADSEGLTVLNMIRWFPTRSIQLNLDHVLEVVGDSSELLKKRDAIVVAIKQEAAKEAADQSQVDFSERPDLRLPGPLNWQQETLTLNDLRRARAIPVALYLPQSRKGVNKQLAPVIVISHGLASDHNTFAYLAQHLASYGFAVAVLEHPGSNAKRFQQFFAGLSGPPEPMELIDRPMEVKYLLDELQRLDKSDPALQGRLNLQQVGVIGHSLGGYTALTLAGAKINFEQLGSDCNNNKSLNMSLLVQCQATFVPRATYPLQDARVKAVIAVNPVTSTILGQSGLSQIQVPLMLVAGSEDIVTPAVPEQIRPFTWLKNPERYLVLIENGTHFSTLVEAANGRGVLPVPSGMIGPNPAIARSYLNALSVAFFKTHIANQPESHSYLSASYAKFVSLAPLKLSLVQSFTAAKLAQVLNKTPSHSAASSGSQPTPTSP